jgi:hypothetical protein
MERNKTKNKAIKDQLKVIKRYCSIYLFKNRNNIKQTAKLITLK